MLCFSNSGVREVEAFADGLGQLLGGIRLLQKPGFADSKILAHDFRAVAAGVDDFEVRLALLQFFGEFAAGHAGGHDHVGEEQIDFAAVFLPDLEGFHAGGGFEDAVVIIEENDAGELTKDRLVLDEENGFFAAAHFGGRAGIGRLGLFGGSGQENFENAAPVDLAGDLDPALVLFHDAINGGQPQTGALADFLGGKEGFKHALERIRPHSAAGIRDGDTNEVSSAGLGILLNVGRVDNGGGGGDDEAAAFGYGIAGVDGEVHDDLLHHAGIGIDGGKPLGVPGFENNVLPEEPVQQLDHVAKDGIDIEHAGLHDLFAAEHKQLAREAGG